MRHDSPQSFHISFWRPWLLAVSLLAIPLLIGAGMSLANGQPSGLIGAVFGLTAVAIVLLIPIGWTVRTSRWDVDAAGISGPDNWHVHRSVRWEEITGISRLPVPGYPFVWIKSTTRRRAFWVPLFFTDMPGFRAAVFCCAPPHNPLRRYLENHSA